VFHSTYPLEFSNGQIVQFGMDAYTGMFNVATTPTTPNPTVAINNFLPAAPLVSNNGNYLDERVAWHIVVFPQPFGIQGEYTIGRGPQLNASRTAVELGSIHGGYLQLYYNYKCDTYCQNVFPYLRVQEYYGGRKQEANAPRTSVREWELGLEYQFNRAVELTVAYTWTQRSGSNPTGIPSFGSNGDCLSGAPGLSVPCTQTPYQLQTGNLIRFQLQWSF